MECGARPVATFADPCPSLPMRSRAPTQPAHAAFRHMHVGPLTQVGRPCSSACKEAYALNFRLDCNQAGGLTKLHICANAPNAVFSNGQSRLQSIRNGS